MSISSLCRSGTPNGSSAVMDRIDAVASPPLPRLLYVVSTKSQGGIERHSVDLAGALAQRGVFVRFACCPGGFVESWCREIRLPTTEFRVRNSGDLGAALRLARIIRAARIDIVHAHSRRDYVVAVLGVALARRMMRRRIGLILHAHMIRPLGDPARLSGPFFEWGADAAVAVSGTVSDRLRHAHQFNPKFVHLLPNGIDLAKFALFGSPEAVRRRASSRQLLAISEDAVVIGMIGRLDAKGQRQLFQVVPYLLPHCPALRVVLIGSEGKEGEQTALMALAHSGGFADRVIFTGARTDIPELLPAFDILVHLPEDEAFGLALAEAMAAGLPAVATAVGGCREVVRDGITGCLVPLGDEEALLTALRLLADPVYGPVRRTEMGQAGRRDAERYWTQEIQTERLLALYNVICPGVPASL